MRKRAYIYAGETVVLRFEAHTEGKVLDLSGYDVEIDIATTAMGHHIVKCSAENSVDVSQAARGMLLCPLSAEDTGSLTPGTATIGVRLLHDKFVRMGFDASIEVLRQGATPSAVLSRTAQPVVTLHTPCIWVNMDFAATRGDDGKTPYVGENGNWFIGDEDTGERALGVTYDDLTPEQIAELQRPATEAAAEANDAAQAAATATKEAKAATEDAKSASDRAERMAEEARNEAVAAASAAEAAATATEEADAAAVTANAAAQAANTAAEGIDEKIANKADLDPETGCVPSAQIAPLQGKQTGVQMGEGRFLSADPALLIDGDRTLAALFYPDLTDNDQQFVYADHLSHLIAPGISIQTIHSEVRVGFGKVIGRVPIKPDTLYLVVVSVKKDEIATVYINSSDIGSNTDHSGITPPEIFTLGSLSYGILPFKGRIIGLRLFNYSLSADEAAALWNGGQPERYMLPRDMLHPNETIFPTATYTPSKNTWKIGVPADGTAEEDVAAANGFSGSFQRITAVNNATLNIYSDFLNSSTAIRSEPKIFQVEYRSGVPIRVVSNGIELLRLDANEGEAKRVSFISQKGKLVYLYPTTAGGYVEIRTLSIETIQCVAEYIPAGLLADKWRDTSGNGLDLPYLSTVAGQPAELDYQQPPATPSGSPLHDLFVAAGAVWNGTTKRWKYSLLSDISTDEMLQMYTYIGVSGGDISCAYANLKARTNFIPLNRDTADFNDSNRLLLYNTFIEVYNSSKTYATLYNVQSMFKGASNLRTITGVLVMTNITSAYDMFTGCTSLSDVHILKLRCNLSLSDSPLITAARVKFIVDNALTSGFPTSGITVTVHADVYAKLTDPTDTDWYAVNAAAQAKNISFATA